MRIYGGRLVFQRKLDDNLEDKKEVWLLQKIYEQELSLVWKVEVKWKKWMDHWKGSTEQQGKWQGLARGEARPNQEMNQLSEHN